MLSRLRMYRNSFSDHDQIIICVFKRPNRFELSSDTMIIPLDFSKIATSYADSLTTDQHSSSSPSRSCSLVQSWRYKSRTLAIFLLFFIYAVKFIQPSSRHQVMFRNRPTRVVKLVLSCILLSCSYKSKSCGYFRENRACCCLNQLSLSSN